MYQNERLPVAYNYIDFITVFPRGRSPFEDRLYRVFRGSVPNEGLVSLRMKVVASPITVSSTSKQHEVWKQRGRAKTVLSRRCFSVL